MRSKCPPNAFKSLQNVYSSDLSNVIFYFMASGTLSFRLIIPLAAHPHHPSTFGSQKLCSNSSFCRAVFPKFAYLISMLPSRPHSVTPVYILPSSSTWNHILSFCITCAFITALRVGMSVYFLTRWQVPGGRPSASSFNAMCFTHNGHATDVCWFALRAVSQRRPGRGPCILGL